MVRRLAVQVRALITVTTSLAVNLITFFLGRAATEGLDLPAEDEAEPPPPIAAAPIAAPAPCRVLDGRLLEIFFFWKAMLCEDLAEAWAPFPWGTEGKARLLAPPAPPPGAAGNFQDVSPVFSLNQ